MSPTDLKPTTGNPQYSFKPSLLGAVWQFELTPSALVCHAGRKSATWPYAKIDRVRLSYRPISLQSQRFRADILGGDGRHGSIVSATWRSMVVVTSQAAEYRAFILELHRRIAAAHGRAVFLAGMPKPIYWAGVTVLTGLSAAMLALLTFSIQEGHKGAALFVVAFLAFSVWQIGGFMKRNRPRRYSPDAIPEDLLPQA